MMSKLTVGNRFSESSYQIPTFGVENLRFISLECCHPRFYWVVGWLGLWLVEVGVEVGWFFVGFVCVIL